MPSVVRRDTTRNASRTSGWISWSWHSWAMWHIAVRFSRDRNNGRARNNLHAEVEQRLQELAKFAERENHETHISRNTVPEIRPSGSCGSFRARLCAQTGARIETPMRRLTYAEIMSQPLWQRLRAAGLLKVSLHHRRNRVNGPQLSYPRINIMLWCRSTPNWCQ
jgi:hypothetical protein